jgi:hypothetical protein
MEANRYTPFPIKFHRPTKEGRTQTTYFNDYELAQLRDWLNSRVLEAEPGLAKGMTYKLEDENVGVGSVFTLTHIKSGESVEFADDESW